MESPNAHLGPHGKRPWHQLGNTGDDLMDNKLLLYLQNVSSQLGDVGEVLDTGTRITTNESWFVEWVRTADRVRGDAEDSLTRGHRISAGKAFLRAANYYRAALIHDNGRDSGRIAYAATNARDGWHQAIGLLELPVEKLTVPYEGTTLPAYLARSSVPGDRPTIIFHSGLDAWPEENWWMAQAAMARGYHMLLLHAPGQGLARRLQGLSFRPDWEKVIMPTVDTVLEMPGVDGDKLILAGWSFGGYLVTRAVAFEPRIHTCIANPGLVSFYDSCTGMLPDEVAQLAETDPAQLAAIIRDGGDATETLRFYDHEIPSRFGCANTAEWLRALKAYDNSPYLDQIECQMLIMDGEAEWFMRGESQRLYDALHCPKELMIFDHESTGAEHCQAGAALVAERRLFDWLDEHVR